MKKGEFVNYLLSSGIPDDADICISVDAVNSDNPVRRWFGLELLHWQKNNGNDYSILMEGEDNAPEADLRAQLEAATARAEKAEKLCVKKDKTIEQLNNRVKNLQNNDTSERIWCPHCNRTFSIEESKHNDW